MKLKKMVIGVRPETKMFRVSSVWGEVFDALMYERGGKLSDDFFKSVGRNEDASTYIILNREKGVSLTIDESNVIFSVDLYSEEGKSVNENDVVNNFEKVWKISNEILQVKDIRRIGVLGEFRFSPTGDVNKLLLSGITSLPGCHYPANFQLKYEKRTETAEGQAPDIKKSDFVNVAYSFYDSSLDTDAPEDDKINANIDYARHYAPLISSNIIKEVKKNLKGFIREKTSLESLMEEKGLV